jgi:hypothetical protein
MKYFSRKPEGMMSVKRPRHRWEDNIKTDHRESVRMWTRSNGFRIGSNDGPLRTR